MRSQAATDLRHGLIACIALVVTAGWVVHVIDRHAEEHGHCAPLAAIDVVLAQRNQGDGKREGQDVGCGGHASFFATGRVSDAVRRPRTDSEPAK